MDAFTDEQRTRFEYYLQSHLQRQHVKAIMARYMGERKDLLTDDMAVVVAGLAKLFVGELMDVAAGAMRAEGGSNVTEDHIE